MKIERLLSLIILLLVKDLVTAKEMAERFNVSQRTIYRDVATLEGAGFPIVAKHGSEGGYSLMAGFKLDAYTFTDEEKGWLLNAVELQGDLLEQTEVGQVIADKLRILYGEKEPESLTISLRDSTIHHHKIEEAVKEKIKLLTSAITEHNKVTLSYVANTGDVTERIVWPLQLKLENGSWFLWSFCELRQSERLFKLTRIEMVEKISTAWQESVALIGEQAVATYGIYHNYAGNYRDDYDLSIGTELIEGPTSVTVSDGGKYQAFPVNLAEENPVYQTWQTIWQQEEQGDLKRAYGIDYEAYASDGSVTIYISVR